VIGVPAPNTVSSFWCEFCVFVHLQSRLLNSPQLAMLILYTGIQEAKEEKRNADEWRRNQEEGR